MEQAIEVKDLWKKYHAIEAVRGISFSVKKGDLFAFLGENGAGKSTTINILVTVLAKTSGRVRVNGFDLDKEAQHIRESIGVVFQGSVLDRCLTVKENLASRGAYYGYYGKGLEERLASLSKLLRLEELWKRRYEDLSGGQRRRVDIARALLHEPEILFLDEPTTGLDPSSRKEIWDIISQLRKNTGLTVFLTTHYMEEASEANEAVILEKGQIVCDDSPLRLKNKYSHNKLIVHHPSLKARELLLASGLVLEEDKDWIKASFDQNSDIIDLLYQGKTAFADYEIVKGDMDDVFLNVTGRKLED